MRPPRLRHLCALALLNQNVSKICAAKNINYVVSAMWPECTIKVWLGKSSWLQARKRDPEVGQRPVGVITFPICPTAMSNPRAACGPVEGFLRPTLVFAVVKVSCILIACPCFDNLEFDVSLQVVFSATLSRVLPLQWGFEFRILSILV